jgi:RHS repeat-associated protein
VRTNYLVAGSIAQVLLEYDANGVITAEYTYGIDLIRKQSANREGFYHTDALGSTRLITDNVGLVLDTYNYDAFGVNLNQTNTFANSFQFAGEQRDGTGLDYLRARYYDSSLGRFISKDPYAGSITDPYSQHSYQYAHANPVRYTDPTGYFTMGDALATIDLMSKLAVAGSTSFGAGYILGAAANGEDIRPLFGEWAAGFASGVSGGFLTDVYEAAMGTKIEPKHALLYQSGNVAGIGTSFILGMRAPTWATTNIGPLKWTSSALTGLDLYGAGKASYTVTSNFIARGNRFEWSDSWNLLSLVPFAGLLLGGTSKVKNFFAANKAAQSPDSAVKTIGSTGTKTGNCFVAGTEILTSEGEKKIEDIQVGDWVVADDPNTVGEIEYKQVLDTFVRHTDKLVDLYIDGEVISTTGEHPFWTPDKGWVEAKDLTVGSLVQTADGRTIDVDRVEKREGDFTVYNFKVEGFHSYFVSDLGVLVHNAGPSYWDDIPSDDLAKNLGNPHFSGGDFNPRSWVKGGSKSVEESLKYHYDKHRLEVGANSLDDYISISENFKDRVLADPNIFPTPVPGPTPNVYRYPIGDQYIDLAHLDNGDRAIVSFGQR